MEGGGGHRGPGRSDLVRERDSDQRGKRKKEQPDMRMKNWSEALAWSVCGCVCVCVCWKGWEVHDHKYTYKRRSKEFPCK